MKTNIKIHLAYHGWAYIVIIVLSSIIWTITFNQLNEIKDHEKVDIFVAGIVDYESLEDDLLAYTMSMDYDFIKQIHVNYQSPTERLFFGIYETMLINGTDMLIIPETMLNDGFGESYFVSIDEEQINQYFTNADVYRENGHAYGILVYEPGQDSTIEPYVLHDQNIKYYAFIPPKSNNLLGLSTSDYFEMNAALEILLWMLGNE